METIFLLHVSFMCVPDYYRRAVSSSDRCLQQLLQVIALNVMVVSFN